MSVPEGFGSEPPVKSGFLSSEFAGNVAKQFVALAGLIFVIEKLDPNTVGGAAGIVAAFVAWLGSSSIDIVSFTKSRTAVKTEAIAALAPTKVSASVITTPPAVPAVPG